MGTTVFPLPAILFQFLFLLVAITIESFILNRQLKLSRKKSIDYAISINLFSLVLGWLGFFYIQGLLPPNLKGELISFLFFDRFITPQAPNFNTFIILSGFLTFFSAFFIKLKGLDFLEALLEFTKPAEVKETKKDIRGRSVNLSRVYQRVLNINPNRATVILFANACTHSAILLILLLRAVFVNNYFRL